MAETDPPQLPSPPRVEALDFYEDHLTVVIIDGHDVVVPIRSVCTVLGIDAQAQSARLREHEVLSQGLRVVKVPVGSRVQSVLAISRRFLPFWLATITPASVNDAARPKLVRYQAELVDLLDALYGEAASPPEHTSTDDSLAQRFVTLAAELRATRAALLQAHIRTSARIEAQALQLTRIEALLDSRLTTLQGELDEAHQRLLDTVKITAAQSAVIRLAIERLGKRYELRHGARIYDRLHARFCAELGTQKYDALPASKYPQALQWLRDRAAEYLPDDADALPPLQEALL
jgi:hypothetical protein